MATLIRLLAILFVTIIAGCGGGGGGGGEFFGPAQITLRANPESIFVRDRTLITTELEEVNEDGIVLAFRYPTSLSYVRDSAKLIVNEDEVEVTPLVNASRNDKTYLVFVFSADAFGKERIGRLDLQLLGVRENQAASVEIDPSIRNTQKPDDQQFNIRNPVFGPEESVEIEVKAG